mmetsp:Transcript_823/g.1284  ORF Transcript_823/g.1284 Transcript_823/m.1284 type:complete len:221 (-) Transcript_823:19-681(-)
MLRFIYGILVFLCLKNVLLHATTSFSFDESTQSYAVDALDCGGAEPCESTSSMLSSFEKMYEADPVSMHTLSSDLALQPTATAHFNVNVNVMWEKCSDLRKMKLFHEGTQKQFMMNEPKRGFGATRYSELLHGRQVVAVIDKVISWEEGETYTTVITEQPSVFPFEKRALFIINIKKGKEKDTSTVTLSMDVIPKKHIDATTLLDTLQQNLKDLLLDLKS